jgi:hypothetical protein
LEIYSFEAQVTIALQLPNGDRFQHTFSPKTTLWEVLQYCEKQLGLNLTKDSGVPEGNSSTQKEISFYKQPVIIFTNKEFASNRELRMTTLQAMGLTKGNGLLRFSFRLTNVPLKEFLEQDAISIQQEEKIKAEEEKRRQEIKERQDKLHDEQEKKRKG